MKRVHNVDRVFCIIAGCGVSQRSAAGLKYHFKEIHDHDTGECQAPEKPEEHHNRGHEEAQSRATDKQGTKRLKGNHKTPPDAKRVKTNRGGEGQDGMAGKQGAMQENPRGQKTSDQHQGQEDFWKKYHDALNNLKAKGRALREDGEPREGTPDGPQDPGTKGL